MQTRGKNSLKGQLEMLGILQKMLGIARKMLGIAPKPYNNCLVRLTLQGFNLSQHKSKESQTAYPVKDHKNARNCKF
jgi:hypothetical protein